MSRWQRFWWAWNVARARGCGLIAVYRHARRFSRNRGRITRQQKRAYDRRLAE